MDPKSKRLVLFGILNLNNYKTVNKSFGFWKISIHFEIWKFSIESKVQNTRFIHYFKLRQEIIRRII